MAVSRANGQKSTPNPIYRPGPPIDGPEALAAALEALRLRDPDRIGMMLALAGPPPTRLQPPGLVGLAAIIVSQQVSVASAAAILARLRLRFAPLRAQELLAASDADFRSCGLSMPKMRTFRALAAAILHDGLDLAALGDLAAADAHRALLAVKGIGPWTADLFLLSCLGHPDAWPAGDLALQEAAKLALGLAARPDARAMEAIGERWRPHRAVAARLLWSYYRAIKSKPE